MLNKKLVTDAVENTILNSIEQSLDVLINGVNYYLSVQKKREFSQFEVDQVMLHVKKQIMETLVI